MATSIPAFPVETSPSRGPPPPIATNATYVPGDWSQATTPGNELPGGWGKDRETDLAPASPTSFKEDVGAALSNLGEAASKFLPAGVVNTYNAYAPRSLAVNVPPATTAETHENTSLPTPPTEPEVEPKTPTQGVKNLSLSDEAPSTTAPSTEHKSGPPKLLASTISPDEDVQAAAKNSTHDYTTPLPVSSTMLPVSSTSLVAPSSSSEMGISKAPAQAGDSTRAIPPASRTELVVPGPDSGGNSASNEETVTSTHEASNDKAERPDISLLVPPSVTSVPPVPPKSPPPITDPALQNGHKAEPSASSLSSHSQSPSSSRSTEDTPVTPTSPTSPRGSRFRRGHKKETSDSGKERSRSREPGSPKPRLRDRIKGSVKVAAGKLTHDEEKIEEGLRLKGIHA